MERPFTLYRCRIVMPCQLACPAEWSSTEVIADIEQSMIAPRGGSTGELR